MSCKPNTTLYPPRSLTGMVKEMWGVHVFVVIDVISVQIGSHQFGERLLEIEGC